MTKSVATLCVAFTLAGMAAGGLPCAAAQAAEADAAGHIALYQGKDREQRLIEGAKKEGQLNVYYSLGDMKDVIDAFTKKYGVKVKGWKSNGENVLRRVVAESQVHTARPEVDLVQNSGSEMEALYREKLLQKVYSPYQADLIPQALPGHREWVATNIDVFVQGYNTNLIKKEDLPKSYEDLLDPKWKGRLGIEMSDQAWFGTLLDAMGVEKGVRLFKEIGDKNGISIRKGHAMLTNLTVAGEVPLSLTNYDYRLEQQKQKGAPIDSFVIPPGVAGLKSIGLLKDATHPHAAILFYDFMLTEGQRILLKTHHIPASTKVASPLRDKGLTFIDSARALDNNDEWTRLYEDTVIKRVPQ